MVMQKNGEAKGSAHGIKEGSQKFSQNQEAKLETDQDILLSTSMHYLQQEQLQLLFKFFVFFLIRVIMARTK